MANERDIELNPRFSVPPGVIDVRQENRDDGSYVYGNDETLAASAPILEFVESTVPNAPSAYRIVSQTMRQTASGQTVVDVELEFPDLGGSFDVDVAVTPA